MLSEIEISQLIITVIEKVVNEINEANLHGNEDIKKILNKYDINEKDFERYTRKKEIHKINDMITNRNKILVIGDSRVKMKDLLGVIKDLRIDVDKVEFKLGYEKASGIDLETLRYSNKYTDILMGPIPHKVKGLDSSTYFISEIENNQEEYPNLIKLIDSNALKITKTSFKNGLLNSKLYKLLYSEDNRCCC